jgi:hypothetical protein
MQEAAFVNLLRTIAIIVLIYYGLKIIGRWAFPLLIKRTMNNMEKRFREQQGSAEPPVDEVGKTTIDMKPQSNKETKDDSGEYIDFEEVE